MSGPAEPDLQRNRQQGHNRISTQALTSTTQAVAAAALAVPPASVRVTLSDDGGALAIGLATPLGLPPLNRVIREAALVQNTGGDAWLRAHRAKRQIMAQVAALTGSIVSRVDIRITGVRPQEGGRVR